MAELGLVELLHFSKLFLHGASIDLYDGKNNIMSLTQYPLLNAEATTILKMLVKQFGFVWQRARNPWNYFDISW